MRKPGMKTAEREEEYKTLLDLNHNPIIITQHGRCQLINSAFEKLFGYTLQDLDNESSALKLFHKSERKGFLKWMEERASQANEDRRENRINIITKEGKIIACEFFKVPIPYRGGTSDLVALHDMTHSTETERRLQASEEKYRLLADNVIDTIWVIDLDTLTFVYCSPSVEKFIGYTDKEVIGRDLEDEFASGGKKPILAFLNETLPTDDKKGIDPTRSTKFEIEVVHKNGSLLWTETTISVLPDGDGKPTALLGIARDITERKKSEKEIQLLTDLIDKSHDEFFVIDPQSGRFLWVNEKACENFGYDKEEFLNMDTVATEKIFADKLDWDKTVQDLREQGSEVLEGIHIRKDGSTFPAEGSMKYISHGDREYVVAMGRDITKRKQAETALRQSEVNLERKNIKLEESNIALKVLLKKIEADKVALENKVLLNVKKLISPYLEKLKRSGLDDKQTVYAELLESYLNDIISQFAYRLSSEYTNITPSEIEVANFVKQGKTTKEIADLMCLSPRTIETHRNNLRKKLGLKAKKENLRSHLLSIQ